VVDPDTLLKANGLDLEMNLFYNSRSAIDGPYGKNRSLSTNCFVLKTTGPPGYAQVVRGDEKVYEFNAGGTSGFTTTYSGVSSQYAGTALIYNSDLDVFIETFPDGKMIVYDQNQGGTCIVWLGFQGDAHSFHPEGIARFVKQNPSDAYAGKVSVSHQPRKEVELAIWPPGGGRVQHSGGLKRISCLGLHRRSYAFELKLGYGLQMNTHDRSAPCRQ
jgi:hypothetical protein